MTTKTDAVPSTPAAEWRANGEPDPHGKHYDCERAALTLGNLTDDELANEAFLNYDTRLSLEDLLHPKPGRHMPIVWMTAVKERIRWLSRALDRALTSANQAAAFKGPAKFTAEEVADGNRGIRWITADGVYGRPTDHDVREYLERTPSMLMCSCEECQAFYRASVSEAKPSCKGSNCGSIDGASHSAECQAQHDAAVAGAMQAEAGHVPDNKVTVARMGYGAVAVGECLSSETGEPGIIYMTLDDVGPIGRDTTDVYPVGSTPPADRVLAYVSFKTPEAVDQTISILEGMKSKYWPAASGSDAEPAAIEPPSLDLAALGEYWHVEREPDESDETYLSRINARKEEFKAWLKEKYAGDGGERS